MLPPQLSGIYRQYKEDTDSVASWLASTAKSCGYPADLLTPTKSIDTTSSTVAKTGRLKGKQRAKARQAEQSKPKPGTADKRKPKHIIAIKDFLPLANFIAGRDKPRVSIPSVFSSTIDRLITLRSAFAGKLSDYRAEPDPVSDEKHGYFVGVLEAVRAALRPGMGPSEPSVSSDSNDETQGLGNRFASLSVEEPSQAFLDAFRDASHERPTPQAQDTTSYEAEPSTSLEDALFAFTLLMNDLNKIRSRIEWIWSNHRDGSFDLGAAAVATNTAISLGRGLIEDIAPILDKQDGGAWGLLNNFFFLDCLRKGYTQDQVYHNHSADNFNYDLYEEADKCCLIAFRLLNSLVDVLHPRELPLIKEGIFGEYHPGSNRSSKSGQEKFQEDQVLLMNYFTELITVIRLVPDYSVEDEFLREMRAVEKTSKVTFTLVFAAQIFLDIHHVMRAGTLHSYNVMAKESNAIEGTLKAHLDFHKDLKIDNWPVTNDHQLRELSRKIKWMAEDPVYGAKAKFYARMGVPVPPEMPVNRIMQYSPILCGLHIFRLRTEMYDVGLAVANAWGSITYTAHLYNALCSENLLENGSWQDMDIMLTMLGDSNIWVGAKRPASRADYFQKFCLQMGVSASAFTTNRRRRTNISSRAGPRGINEGAPVSSMFKTQVCTKAEVDWTPELVDDIVSRSTYEMEGTEDGLVMGQIDDPDIIREKNRVRQQKAKDQAAGKRVPDSRAHDSGDLVKTLTLALTSESLETAFPWLMMHRWCWRLLRAVKDSCDPCLRELYTPAYMEKESELPWVVGYIFMAASGLDRGQDLRLLRLAAEAFDGMLSVGGGQMAIKAAAHIGKHIEFEDEHGDGSERVA